MQTKTSSGVLAATLAAAMLAAPADAEAAYPNHEYSFLEMDHVDYDQVDGFALIGSWELGSNAFIKAGYEELENTSPFNNATVETLQLGGGFAFPIAATTDLHFGAAAVKQSFGAADESGIQVDAGIRSKLSNVIEVYGDIRHREIDNFDEDLVGAGLRFHLTPIFHLSFGVEDADDYDGYRVGARFTF